MLTALANGTRVTPLVLLPRKSQLLPRKSQLPAAEIRLGLAVYMGSTGKS